MGVIYDIGVEEVRVNSGDLGLGEEWVGFGDWGVRGMKFIYFY